MRSCSTQQPPKTPGLLGVLTYLKLRWETSLGSKAALSTSQVCSLAGCWGRGGHGEYGPVELGCLSNEPAVNQQELFAC